MGISLLTYLLQLPLKAIRALSNQRSLLKGSLNQFSLLSFIMNNLVLIAFAILGMAHLISGECCPESNTKGCCTKVGWCCSTKPCNIFCCDCHDCCGEFSGRKKRFISMMTNKTSGGYRIMKRADIDGDEQLDVSEAIDYLTWMGKFTNDEGTRIKRSVEVPWWFVDMDKNGDGYIQPLELDSDY